MPQRLPKSMWPVILLVAIIMGIGPGIIFAQNNYDALLAIVGWLATIFEVVVFIISIFNSHALNVMNQFNLLAPLAYPLAMLGYSACAYWTMRRTGSMSEGLAVLTIATCVSTLASVLVSIIVGTVITSQNFLSILQIMPLWSIPTFINLFVSAFFGWLIAAGLTRRYRRNIRLATAAAYERSGDKTLPL